MVNIRKEKIHEMNENMSKSDNLFSKNLEWMP